MAWGWLFVVFFVLIISWETYKLIKAIDFVSGIQWTFLQITVPEDNPQTPKSMENAFDVWSGIHKSPDIIEKYFEGFMGAWFSCELECEVHRVRYILVVPTNHRKFFEGVVYGQYPTAEIKEVEDYTLRWDHRGVEKEFDVFGTEIVLAQDDVYPVRTYHDYEDKFAEDDTFVDPHQALVEAYTNLREGDRFWVQVLVRPVDAKTLEEWTKKGEEEILKIGGRAKPKPESLFKMVFNFFVQLPADIVRAITLGPGAMTEEEKKQERPLLPNPTEQAKMEGILRKVSRTGFKTKIRVIHISKTIPFHKQNSSTALGAFKQFSSFNLNSFKPESSTKTNTPTYIFKQSRRRFRKRRMLLLYQWRDLWGDSAGQLMSAEELATIYHFPVKYLKAPAIERAVSGLGSAPENIPYV